MDRYVADATGLSRSYVQKLISDGRLTADGEALRANAIVAAGHRAAARRPGARRRSTSSPAPDIPLTIVYEDDDLLIVDKPAGLVVHPAPGHSGDTLVNALLATATASTWGGIAGVQRPGIVHRLDRDTSGLLMVARHDAAQASIMAQLKARRVKKTYLALVQGSVSAAVGRIEAPIGRDPKHRTKMAVVPDGRPSVTGYRVRERFTGWTLLELDLVTGRTHQIRVHLEAIGHPVAGDPVYGTGTSRRGPDGLDRLFLHAWRLELTSPSDGHLIRATRRSRRSSRPCSTGCARSSGDRGVAGIRRGADATARQRRDAGRSSRGRAGSARTRSSTRSSCGPTIPTTTTSSPARPGRCGPARSTASTTTSSTARRSPRSARPAEFLEANEVHGNWYGTPRDQVREALAAGRDVILKIDVQGAQVVKEKVPGALLIFLIPPSLEDLFQRLRSRATETADELELRQRNAAIELARQEDYDYVVTNETGQVERTAERIDEIIADEHAGTPTAGSRSTPRSP